MNNADGGNVQTTASRRPTARRLLLISAAILMLMLTIAACGPFGDDDDDDATATPTTTATASETESEDATATEDADATDEASATEDENSTPSADGTAGATEGEDAEGTTAPSSGTQQPLQPPQARLTVGNSDTSIVAATGSYGWQFQDQMESFIVSQAPLVTMTDDQLVIDAGTELSFEIFGDFYDPSNPPPSLKLSIYDFAENSAIPLNTEGEVTSEVPVFVKQTEPVQQSDLDPANPTFTIDVPSGMYAVEIIGDWGPHPEMDTRNIMVTWVFNVKVN